MLEAKKINEANKHKKIMNKRTFDLDTYQWPNVAVGTHSGNVIADYVMEELDLLMITKIQSSSIQFIKIY